MSLVIVIPTYNKADNMEAITAELLAPPHIPCHPHILEDRCIGRWKMTIPIKVEAAFHTWQIQIRHKHPIPGERHTGSEMSGIKDGRGRAARMT